MALTENHKRAVWATLMAIEKRADEIYALLEGMPESSTYSIENDLNEEESAQTMARIGEIKKSIHDLCIRFELDKQVTPLSRMISTSRSVMWENILDTDTKKLQNYGAFLNEDEAVILQQNLQYLLSLTEQLLDNRTNNIKQ
jgi:hypothetical protein